MSNVRIINLVATAERLKRDFPDSHKAQSLTSGIMSADYRVDLSRIETKLGQWLAEHIDTTRRDDDASSLSILLPHTEAGLHFRDLGEQLVRQTRVRSKADSERLLQMLETWVKEKRATFQAYAPWGFRVVGFDFPVYGSRAADGADTPEAYFDTVARQVRATGGVIRAAGLGDDALPESLARTMAVQAGGGEYLLRAHREHPRGDGA